MLSYLPTTLLILGWCLLFSLIWTQASFLWQARRAPSQSTASSGRPNLWLVVPALLLGPFLVVMAFRAMGINLIFPVSFEATATDLVLITIPPAAVLFFASGLALSLSRAVRSDYAHWRQKTFVLAAQAMGRNEQAGLHRLVYGKALAASWLQCLPWLFGELIIVEAVFNAPGLGLDAWHLARTRDLPGLVTILVVLAVLYGAALGVSALTHRWLGRRLETYG